jgi:hypothetical protein
MPSQHLGFAFQQWRRGRWGQGGSISGQRGGEFGPEGAGGGRRFGRVANDLAGEELVAVALSDGG